jgi:hypothetical protein
MKWDPTRAAFAQANEEAALLPVHICDVKTQGLPQPQAAAVEDTNQQSESPPAQRQISEFMGVADQLRNLRRG